MNHTDDFDRILDKALAHYGNAEPLNGLEERVLQRLQLQADRKRKLWWQYSVAALTAALLVVAVGIGIRAHSQRQLTPPVTAHHQSIAGRPTVDHQNAAASTAAQGANHHRSKFPATRLHPNEADLQTSAKRPLANSPTNPHRDASSRATSSASAQFAKARRSPVQERFPISPPLSSEEHALVALVRSDPGALQALKRGDEEITIAPIEIKPLEDATQNQGEN